MRRLQLILMLGIITDTQAAPLVVQRVSETNFVSDSRHSLPEFSKFATYRNELYFTASETGDSTHRLYKTDGTNLVKFDIDSGYASGTHFSEYQTQLYFRGDSGDGIELFRTDGTTWTQHDLSTSPYGSAPRNFTVVGDYLYFAANLRDSAGVDRETLVSVHGSTISPVADIEVASSYPWHFPVGNMLYFTANGPDGYELYRTDGVFSRQVVDANPGAASSDPWPQIEFNGEFYFTAGGLEGRELYKTHGDTVTKLPLAADPDMYGGPLNFVRFGNHLYFVAKGTNGYELYRTDGQTVTEYDLNPGMKSSGPQTYSGYVLGDRLLIPATGTDDLALFVLNREGDLVRQLNLHPNVPSQGAIVFHEFKGEAYFAAIGADGPELYKTNGDTLTQFDIVPHDATFGGAWIWDAAEYNGELYFPAMTSSGWELVKTDGTHIETFDINPGAPDSYPTDLVVLGDRLVFRASGTSGEAVYSTDGNTVLKLANLTRNLYTDWDDHTYELPASTRFARLGNQLLFLANTPAGFRLHRIAAVPEPVSPMLVAAAIGLLAFTRGAFVERLRQQC